MRQRWILCLLSGLLFALSPLHALNDWEQVYESMIAEADDEESASWLHLYEELGELYARPLNINTATREQLEAYPFLSAGQVEGILAYIYRYGPMKSLGELSLIEELDYSVRTLLRYFIYVGEVEKQDNFSWKDVWKYGRHEVVTRVDIPFYEKAGYADYPDSVLARSPNKRYLGEPFYHSLRYNFRYADKLQAGFVLEKDAGEPFFTRGFNGYDYYAFYVMLTNVGHLKALAVGDYRLRFGQGLVMNTDFNPGKMAILSSLGWGKRGIKKHSSTSEHNAFRGVAATGVWGKLEATAFFSRRKHDATLDDDLFITTLKTDGLHRTPSEYLKKNNVSNTLFGSNLTCHFGAFHAGLTAVYNVFDNLLKPQDVAYKRYYPRGREFYTVGGDYMYNSYRITLSGEAAFSRGGGWGMLNKVQWRLDSDCLLTFVQRYYSRDFWSLYGNSFAENSLLRNENGLYVGVETTLGRRWALSGYVDFCYFPWLKYRVSSSSYSGEAMLRATCTWNDSHQSVWRYRVKVKELDYKAVNGKKYLATQVHHRVRYQHNYSPGRLITLSSQIDFNLRQFMEEVSCGWMISERLTWKPYSSISLIPSICYFHTNDFDTRVTTYERGLLYTFSYPSFYSHGWHFSTVGQWTINRQLTALVKFSHTHYFDRSTIGSGNDLIQASHREDIAFQLRWKW